MDEGEARRVLTETFKQLDNWDGIPGPFIPGSGSDLKGDDHDWPPFGVSQVAWAGLQVALDSLQAIRWHLDVSKAQSPRHFVFADLASCRAALIGASQAVWVLAPNKREARIERARTVASYTQEQHEKYLKGLLDWASAPDANTATVLAHVQKRIAELYAKRTGDGQKTGLNTTKMIREAATEAFSADLAKEVVLAWQEASGAAHGLVWQLLGQQSTVQSGPAAADGLAQFQVVGSFDRIANPYMAAYHLTDRGWNLLRQRGA